MGQNQLKFPTILGSRLVSLISGDPYNPGSVYFHSQIHFGAFLALETSFGVAYETLTRKKFLPDSGDWTPEPRLELESQIRKIPIFRQLNLFKDAVYVCIFSSPLGPQAAVSPVPVSVTCPKSWPSLENSTLPRRSDTSHGCTACPTRSTRNGLISS